MFGEGFYPISSTMPYLLNCTSDSVKEKIEIHITFYMKKASCFKMN